MSLDLSTLNNEIGEQKSALEKTYGSIEVNLDDGSYEKIESKEILTVFLKDNILEHVVKTFAHILDSSLHSFFYLLSIIFKTKI